MRAILLAAIATAAVASGATAADYRYYGQSGPRGYVEPYPYPAGMKSDEVRNYEMEMLKRRQEIERQALEFRQRAERRLINPND